MPTLNTESVTQRGREDPDLVSDVDNQLSPVETEISGAYVLRSGVGVPFLIERLDASGSERSGGPREVHDRAIDRPAPKEP